MNNENSYNFAEEIYYKEFMIDIYNALLLERNNLRHWIIKFPHKNEKKKTYAQKNADFKERMGVNLTTYRDMVNSDLNYFQKEAQKNLKNQTHFIIFE